jgi:hypothetical protein
MYNSKIVANAPVACATVVVCFFATAAGASFTATLDAYGSGEFAACGYNSQLSWNSTDSVALWNIKAFQHDFSRSAGEDILSWCAEVYQSVNVGSSYLFDEVAVEQVPTGGNPGPLGSLKAVVIRDLFARWVDPATGLVIGSVTDRDAKSAAFQLAIWEISHENFAATDAASMVNEMSLGLGAFRSTPSGAASGWYDAIRNSLGVGGFQSAVVLGLSSPSAQDQLVLVPIPAPGALALLALVGVSSRRRR